MKFENAKQRKLREQIEKKLELAEMRISEISSLTPEASMDLLDSSKSGLSEFIVNASRDYYGDNILQSGEEVTVWDRLKDAFINPFSLILMGLAVVSLFTDIIFAEEKTPFTVIIITAIVLFSGILRFTQEARSGSAAEKLAQLVNTTTNVTRKGLGRHEIPMDEVVVGDIIHLAAGDMVPADARVLDANDLFVNQSALTGESEPVEKTAAAIEDYKAGSIASNVVYMGSNVISGSATCLVVAVGNATMVGSVAKKLGEVDEEPTSFEKGVNAVSTLLLRFMLVMVPFVFITSGIISKNWFSAFLFAISIAVGLTPEMLPMLVSTCLSRGAVAMAEKKTVVKNLNAIQNLGSIDILCTDKTGTITQNKVVLQYNLDVNGNDDLRVLRHAFINSYFQTGLRNLMDASIIEYTDEEAQYGEKELQGLRDRYHKIDEIPFDFERRRLSVVVEDASGKRQMVTKGAVEEMVSISSYAEIDGEVVPLTDEIRQKVFATVEDLNEDGMRVIAVAQKTNPSPQGAFSVADESDMVLLGYLAFLDPPKESSVKALQALKKYGVATKILTGDNDLVTASVCKQVGLDVDNILLGADIDEMTDEELSKAVETTNVFAKVTPAGKERIVTMLRKNGHSVGFMGDGINDAPAMKAADIGISVDNAVDIAKESADVILLEKNLLVLEDGIIEGRKCYANMLKYIKLAASSNFGNMFSVLAAAIALPFQPMASVQLLLLNLIYDISCTSIPWDRVDEEMLAKPVTWDAQSVSKFMIWFGPMSSICDIITFAVLYFIVCPAVCGGSYKSLTDPAMRDHFVALFQSGWFIESMWTQSLVIHLIRTKKMPFFESNASAMVYFLTSLGIALANAVVYIPVVGPALGFAALPAITYLYFAGILALYFVLVTICKKFFVKKYGILL